MLVECRSCGHQDTINVRENGEPIFPFVCTKCLCPWFDKVELPLGSLPLTKEMIDRCFEDAETQADYTIALYRLAFPKWDEISKVNGFPAVSKQTGEYIFQCAIEFDKEHHPNVLNGGMWLNNGFRSEPTIESWVVVPCEVERRE